MRNDSTINSILSTLRARASSPLPDMIQIAGGSPAASSLEDLAAAWGATPVDENTLEPLEDTALADMEPTLDEGQPLPDEVVVEAPEPEPPPIEQSKAE